MNEIRVYIDIITKGLDKYKPKRKKMETKEVHISKIKVGDVIVHNGEVKTVNKEYLKYDSFLGHRVFGDGYCCGSKPVILVTKL